MNIKSTKFTKTIDTDFAQTLRKKVNAYFADQGISKYANLHMVVKSIGMFAFYFVPYFFIIFNLSDVVWVNLLFWAIMAVGMAGIGFGVMHDANHGAYSKNKWINNLMANSINIIGASDAVWKLQHNILHHTYTNIEGLDEDIDSDPYLRFNPHQELKRFHKYQFLYAPFLYSIMTLSWTSFTDFTQAVRYKKFGLIRSKKQLMKEIRNISIWKVVYFAYILAIPLIFSNQAWYFIVLGFVIMQLLTGLYIALVFQAAHVVPVAAYPKPNKEGNMDNNWMVHQLQTTANFATNSKLFSWFAGGLNFQVEHHLFPNICHVHYPKIAKIVENTAKEFGHPYFNYNRTVLAAFIDHFRMLKQLGRA